MPNTSPANPSSPSGLFRNSTLSVDCLGGYWTLPSCLAKNSIADDYEMMVLLNKEKRGG